MRKKVSLLMLLAFCSMVAMEKKENKDEQKDQKKPKIKADSGTQEGKNKAYEAFKQSFKKEFGIELGEGLELSVKPDVLGRKQAWVQHYARQEMKKIKKARSLWEFLGDQKDDFAENYGTFLVQYSAQQAAVMTADAVGYIVVRPVVDLVHGWYFQSEIAAAQKQQANIEYQKASAEYGKSLGNLNETSLNRFEKLHAIAQKTGLLDRYAKHKVEMQMAEQLASEKFLKMQKKFESIPESEHKAFLEIAEKEMRAIQEELNAARKKAGFSQSEASMIQAIEHYDKMMGDNALKEAMHLTQDCDDKEEKFMCMIHGKGHTVAE
jgi:hypothetical protein